MAKIFYKNYRDKLKNLGQVDYKEKNVKAYNNQIAKKQ